MGLDTAVRDKRRSSVRGHAILPTVTLAHELGPGKRNRGVPGGHRLAAAIGARRVDGVFQRVSHSDGYGERFTQLECSLTVPMGQSQPGRGNRDDELQEVARGLNAVPSGRRPSTEQRALGRDENPRASSPLVRHDPGSALHGVRVDCGVDSRDVPLHRPQDWLNG